MCHHCDNPPCCNPRHLFRGTASDNALDAVRKGRWNWKRASGNKGSGEKSPFHKLTQKQVNQIRRLAKAGTLTQASIGKKFRVGQDEISRIVHRKRWA